ncbi:hypothetical protein [Parabacteroides pacaensis]|uniref:hypothetical protein n=1 Tax=Parabacteroides pacaensis TaxID=2086575 RepID=UPI000D0EAA68|nr:hypothetical protein [Parabacteroides pacaensis]
MNSEETKFIQDEETKGRRNNSEANNSSTSHAGNKEKKGASAASNAAFGAGGFVAGAAATFATQAAAANKENVQGEPHVTNPQETPSASTQEQPDHTNESASYATPHQEDVILATDEGIRVAQVNDDQSFSEAFADARAQVGPGGVFEWHGNVYGTYYKEEWDNMTPADRHEFQTKIDYQDVTSGASAGTNTSSHLSSQGESFHETSETSYHQVDSSDSENEIKILGMEEIYDENGNPMTVAAADLQGHEVLLVDIDHDGKMDVVMADANGDGQISGDEVIDISDADIQVSDLQQSIAADNNSLLAHDDGLPDYMPDADAHNYMA